MAQNRFPSNFKRDMFGKFCVFANRQGELEVADLDKEIVMQNRETGIYHKTNLDDLIKCIRTFFPTKEEQKELLFAMFKE